MPLGPTTLAGTYSSFVPTDGTYMSYSYYDDLALGACWLFKATGAPEFLQECQQHYAMHLSIESRAANATVFDFRRSVWAVDMLLYSITRQRIHADRCGEPQAGLTLLLA
jgi:hypothetical protein